MSERRVPLDRVGLELMEAPGTTMAFEIARDDLTCARQPGTTFSGEGLDQMIDGIKAFILTRCFRELQAQGPMMKPTHKTGRAVVTFTVDDQVPDGVTLEMDVIDGEVRIRAVEG